MKRIQSACLEQTILFEQPDELRHYKAELDRKRIPYKVLSESVQPDGSVLLRLKKRYNQYSLGDYLDRAAEDEDRERPAEGPVHARSGAL